jgi:hypothetical protein
MTALNTNPSRRVFIMQAMVASGGVLTAQQVAAQAALAESDAQAVALGYKSDASKVDKAKQTRYAAGQVCSNCALFQAASGAAAGACPLFAGKQVAAKAWCTAWAKKA